MTHTPVPENNTTRLEAFSDGVFAIAITLLILEIKIPGHEALTAYGGLHSYLMHLWPAYLSYILTFFMIGVYWSNHHWLFSFVERTDHYFNMLNVFFLMSIAFLPFPAAIFGDFVMSEEYRTTAVSTFCIGVLLPVPLVLIVYLYAVQGHRLVNARLTATFIRRQRLKLLGGMAFATIALIISFFYPLVSLGLICVQCLMFLLPPDRPEYK